MSLIIDGYNLLHATGIIGRGLHGRGLERSRIALLNFVAKSLDRNQRNQSTVVFDAKAAPTGLPRKVQHQGITVLYASGYEDADALIEELIQACTAPRHLTVVSSDHRIQRAARRRRATAVDSAEWYSQAWRELSTTMRPDSKTSDKPHAPLSEAELQLWLAEFADVSVDELHTENSPAKADESNHDRSAYSDLQNPFPPGYGEDLLDD